MDNSWKIRTQILLGQEKLHILSQKHVLIAGLGGVGGICAEMIARSGVGKMTIIDADVVDNSNRNRQLVALHSTIGKKKTDIMALRLKDINPDLELTIINTFITPENIEDILKQATIDHIVDCIDTIKNKIGLIKAALALHIPITSSMGAGAKLDPTKVQIADIEKSYQCPLARYVRKALHRDGIRGGFEVVFSTETSDPNGVIPLDYVNTNKSTVGTISYMPNVFGCVAASNVIKQLANLKI